MKNQPLQLPPKYSVLGLGISEITFDGAVNLFLNAAATGQKIRANFCAVNNVVAANENPVLREYMSSSQIAVPDGMPLVWLGRLKGRKVERICGPDFMPALCERSRQFGYRHFFYGGADGVAEQLAQNLTQRFPGLQVAGMYTPPFRPLTEEEDADIVARINQAKPDFVWVGLSTPKQDEWIATHQTKLDAPNLLAVGAAFDFHSGNLQRAPRWIQRSGFEWFYRLVREPKRLWRRYLVGNTMFVLYLAAEILRIRKTD